MPRCDRPEGDQSCRDCGADFTERPGPVMKRLEFCDPCVGSWTSLLLDVERVYLIVPGIRRARADDEAEVYRFGVRPIIEAALSALPRRPSRYRQLWHRNLPAYYPRHGMFLQGGSRHTLRPRPRLTIATDRGPPRILRHTVHRGVRPRGSAELPRLRDHALRGPQRRGPQLGPQRHEVHVPGRLQDALRFRQGGQGVLSTPEEPCPLWGPS